MTSMLDPDGVPGSGDEVTRLQQINQRLANHTPRHGPLGDALRDPGRGRRPARQRLQPDDFTDREVADTDGDGLLEFVDSWGRPLQFYRWPIYYVSEYGLAQGLQQRFVAIPEQVERRGTRARSTRTSCSSPPSWWANLSLADQRQPPGRLVADEQPGEPLPAALLQPRRPLLPIPRTAASPSRTPTGSSGTGPGTTSGGRISSGT